VIIFFAGKRSRAGEGKVVFSIRFFYIFSPSQDGNALFAKVLASLLDKKTLTVESLFMSSNSW